MIKRLSIALILLAAGLVAGLVLNGRMQTDDVAVAQPSESVEAPAEAQRPVAVAASPGPDFTRVAEQAVGAVANISSVQVVRQRQSPFFYDPFFEQFFGDSGFGARDRYASSLGSGVVVSADGYVVTNNHVLGEGRIDKVTVSLGRSARASGAHRGRGHVDRSGVAQGGRGQLAGDPLGQLLSAEDRRVGHGDWQSLSAQSIGFAGHCQRARAQRHGHHRLRGLHPDRRGDQPGQFRRRAGQQPRRAHRHQYRYFHAERRISGDRLCGAKQSRAPHRR